MDIDELVATIEHANVQANIPLIRKAFMVAQHAHAHQKRLSGEPYIVHPLRVARILVNNGFCDTPTICAALLHDVIEDTPVTYEQVVDLFGKEIAHIVQGVSKIEKLPESTTLERKAENMRKLLLATAKDPRVMIVKLSDRLHNMQTLHFASLKQQHNIAEETLHVYAPLAEKLGLGELKGRLEYYCFKYLYPDIFTALKQEIELSRQERKARVEQFKKEVLQYLSSHHLQTLILARAKHLYSIYQKMQKKGKLLHQIYDLYALRIICETPQQCYIILELLKETYTFMQERFKDYIAHPKANGYQSLHAVYVMDGSYVEVQIRTRAMNEEAEHGTASHAEYKQTERDKRFEQKINWIRQFMQWLQTHPDAHHLRELTIDVFHNQIIVLTPKGDPVILPEGASAVDFAFAIHSDVGQKAIRADVNGEVVGLSTQLHSGDVVSIVTGKQQSVSSSWLSCAKSPDTIAKIKRALQIPLTQKPPKVFTQKKKQIEQMRQQAVTLAQVQTTFSKTKMKISQCCQPKPGDSVVAFRTRDRKMITIHKSDCPNQFALDKRLQIQIGWNKEEKNTIQLRITAKDSSGIIGQLLDHVYTYTAITHVSSYESKQHLIITINAKKPKDMQGLLQSLRAFEGVLHVEGV
ncbi:MAG: RelA/SpoT family protein [Candidatus Woesearchaeota archaeon]